MINPEIDSDGTKIWKNPQGQFHNEDGPAVIYSDGYEAWYINGKPHREDGPAIIYANGDKIWFIDSKEVL